MSKIPPKLPVSLKLSESLKLSVPIKLSVSPKLRAADCAPTWAYPSSGDGVKFDPKEFLGRSSGPTVGRMSLQGYLAYENFHPLGSLQGPRHKPTVGS